MVTSVIKLNRIDLGLLCPISTKQNSDFLSENL